jgi:hypothetical protein
MRNGLNGFSKKTLLMIGIVASLVVLSGVGMAAASALTSHPPAQGTTNLAHAPGSKQGNGAFQGVARVTAINGKRLSVAPGNVLKQGQEVTIMISDQTSITRYGQPASLSDILVDEFISIRGKNQETISQIDILGYGVAGSILSLHDGGFSLQTTQSGMVNVSIDQSAQIVEEHGLKLRVTDLQTGEAVQVFGEQASEASFKAHLVQVRLLNGQVTAIAGNLITVSRGAKQQPGTVITNDGTTYYVADDQVPGSALRAGDTIEVAGPLSADQSSIIAISIFIHKDQVSGKVTAVKGNTITLQDKADATWAITVDGTTRYIKQDRSPATVSDVQVGSVITAVGTRNGDHALAALLVGIAIGKK